MDLSALHTTLPLQTSSSQHHDSPDAALLSAFKEAAKSVTLLYKTSASATATARSEGYVDALSDVLQVLDHEAANNDPSFALVRLREWVIQARRRRNADGDDVVVEDDHAQQQQQHTQQQQQREPGQVHTQPTTTVNSPSPATTTSTTATTTPKTIVSYNAPVLSSSDIDIDFTHDENSSGVFQFNATPMNSFHNAHNISTTNTSHNNNNINNTRHHHHHGSTTGNNNNNNINNSNNNSNAITNAAMINNFNGINVNGGKSISLGPRGQPLGPGAGNKRKFYYGDFFDIGGFNGFGSGGGGGKKGKFS